MPKNLLDWCKSGKKEKRTSPTGEGDSLSENIYADYEKGIVALVHDESHINKYFRTHDCKVLSAEYCFPEEWITCDFSPKIIFRDKVKLNPYFNKGRDYSLKGKLKKTVSVIYRAIRWYL